MQEERRRVMSAKPKRLFSEDVSVRCGVADPSNNPVVCLRGEVERRESDFSYPVSHSVIPILVCSLEVNGSASCIYHHFKPCLTDFITPAIVQGATKMWIVIPIVIC